MLAFYNNYFTTIKEYISKKKEYISKLHIISNTIKTETVYYIKSRASLVIYISNIMNQVYHNNIRGERVIKLLLSPPLVTLELREVKFKKHFFFHLLYIYTKFKHFQKRGLAV